MDDHQRTNAREEQERQAPGEAMGHHAQRGACRRSVFGVGGGHEEERYAHRQRPLQREEERRLGIEERCYGAGGERDEMSAKDVSRARHIAVRHDEEDEGGGADGGDDHRPRQRVLYPEDGQQRARGEQALKYVARQVTPKLGVENAEWQSNTWWSDGASVARRRERGPRWLPPAGAVRAPGDAQQ